MTLPVVLTNCPSEVGVTERLRSVGAEMLMTVSTPRVTSVVLEAEAAEAVLVIWGVRVAPARRARALRVMP